MSILFTFFYSCWLLFLDFLRLIAKGLKRLAHRQRKAQPPPIDTQDNEDESEKAFNELLTLEELLEDEKEF